MKKKLSASSQRERPRRRKGESTRRAVSSAGYFPSRRQLTENQKRELTAIAALPDDQIDTSDIPELPPGAWKNAVRGGFYRPLKRAVSLRLDSDVVAWLKKPGKGYQTRANYLLRQQMLADMRKR